MTIETLPESLIVTKILRDNGLSQLIAGELKTVATGLAFTEGPLWLPDGTLLFQDLKANRTPAVSAQGAVRTLRDYTRGANGQTFGPDGRIIFCEQDGRRVSVMNRDGSQAETLVERIQGSRVNSPNDIITRRNGSILFTDPPYGVPRPEDKELPYQAVFQLDRSGDLQPVVWEEFEKPNGLALSPDESVLYVNDTGKYHVRAFDCAPGGQVLANSSRVVATFDPAEPGGPDGIKVDGEGRLYVAVAEGIWVLEASGCLLGIIATPRRPSNLAWGGAEGRTLAITAVDQVHTIEMKVAGVLPPFRDLA